MDNPYKSPPSEPEIYEAKVKRASFALSPSVGILVAMMILIVLGAIVIWR